MQQYLHTHVQPRFHLQTHLCVMKLLLLFVLLVTSLGKRKRRRADLKTDDGELEEEEERGEDKLEDEELSPPDHIAGVPMERDRCLNMVSVCVCGVCLCVCVWCVSVCVCTICVCTHVCGVCVSGRGYPRRRELQGSVSISSCVAVFTARGHFSKGAPQRGLRLLGAV